MRRCKETDIGIERSRQPQIGMVYHRYTSAEIESIDMICFRSCCRELKDDVDPSVHSRSDHKIDES